jgi:hypothetical protein
VNVVDEQRIAVDVQYRAVRAGRDVVAALRFAADEDFVSPREVRKQARDIVLVKSFGVFLTVRRAISLKYQQLSVANNFHHCEQKIDVD